MQLIIATNIKKLLQAKKNAISNQTQLAGKSGIVQTTISRILSCSVGTSIDSIQGIADAFKLEAWQLLVTDFDPKNPPVLNPLSDKQLDLYKKLISTAKELGVETGSFAAVPDKPKNK